MNRSFLLSSIFCVALMASSSALAQSPETAMREYASGQIKKGVRSIGFGGDGATWGNYSLVYRDAGNALVDGGATAFTNGNAFSFAAVGATSPELWHGLSLYALALGQRGTGIHFDLKSPGLGASAVPVAGSGADQALFVKAAMPLGAGFSLGVLISYELSQFDVKSAAGQAVHFETQWRPSGGIGLTWQPHPRFLIGARGIFNHDLEVRADDLGQSRGITRSYEGRLGASFSPWKGALLDAGFTVLDRDNAIRATHTTTIGPNLGVEQSFFDRLFALRLGLDETTFGAGFSVVWRALRIDGVYLYNLGSARNGALFGATSHSAIFTLSLDYAALLAPRPG